MRKIDLYEHRLNHLNDFFIVGKSINAFVTSASVEDLRQMYAYARFWKAEKVMLLYPGTKATLECLL